MKIRNTYPMYQSSALRKEKLQETYITLFREVNNVPTDVRIRHLDNKNLCER